MGLLSASCCLLVLVAATVALPSLSQREDSGDEFVSVVNADEGVTEIVGVTPCPGCEGGSGGTGGTGGTGGSGGTGGTGGTGGGGGSGGTGSCTCGVPNLTRIVNGATVSPAHKYPWHVGLKTEGGSNYWCGGTVINNKYVMTAAHCFYNTAGERESDDGLVVGVADHDMNTDTDDVSGVTRLVKVKEVKIHEKYNPKGHDSDIALLLLEETLDLSKNKELRSVCLPADDSKTYAGVTGIATGWGRVKDGGDQAVKLQEVELPILEPLCWNHDITGNMVCAGYKDGSKDTCQGDSGGPLYVKENSKLVQVGITSFGIAGCAVADKPGVYVRVTKFLPWIKEKTSDATYCN